MTAKILAYAPALCPLFGVPTFAQQLPRFCIEATCRTVQALTPQDVDPMQGCIRDETEAERRLKPSGLVLSRLAVTPAQLRPKSRGTLATST